MEVLQNGWFISWKIPWKWMMTGGTPMTKRKPPYHDCPRLPRNLCRLQNKCSNTGEKDGFCGQFWWVHWYRTSFSPILGSSMMMLSNPALLPLPSSKYCPKRVLQFCENLYIVLCNFSMQIYFGDDFPSTIPKSSPNINHSQVHSNLVLSCFKSTLVCFCPSGSSFCRNHWFSKGWRQVKTIPRRSSGLAAPKMDSAQVFGPGLWRLLRELRDILFRNVGLIYIKADWWFGTWLLWFSIQLGIIIPSDAELIFFRGVETTNQIYKSNRFTSVIWILSGSQVDRMGWSSDVMG